MFGSSLFGSWGRATEPAGKKPVAVVTMAYNEPDMLPIWLKHYSREVGIDNCHVIDHGSDDGSTAGLGCSVSRLARSPFDDSFRAALVTGYCAALLHGYDTVVYTDCDELIRADPDAAGSLADFLAGRDGPSVGFVLGMDVVHAEGEPPFDPALPILAQRQWVRPSHALCKPLVIRRPFRWSPGFHYGDEGAEFCGLYLFHVAYADETVIRRRQAKRNATPPVVGGDHHGFPPDAMVERFRTKTPWKNRVLVALGGCEGERAYLATLTPWSCQPAPMVWRIPDRFRSGVPT